MIDEIIERLKQIDYILSRGTTHEEALKLNAEKFELLYGRFDG